MPHLFKVLIIRRRRYAATWAPCDPEKMVLRRGQYEREHRRTVHAPSDAAPLEKPITEGLQPSPRHRVRWLRSVWDWSGDCTAPVRTVPPGLVPARLGEPSDAIQADSRADFATSEIWSGFALAGQRGWSTSSPKSGPTPLPPAEGFGHGQGRGPSRCGAPSNRQGGYAPGCTEIVSPTSGDTAITGDEPPAL